MDWTAINSSVIEEIASNNSEYGDLLQGDHNAMEWDEDEQYFEPDSDSDIEDHYTRILT